MKMKKYQKPVSEKISLEVSYNVMDMSMTIHKGDPASIDDIDDWTITDGSQILSPRINLWEEEEE